MQQTKLYIKGAAQELEHKMKGELYSVIKSQIALGKHVMMTIDAFADLLIALENKIITWKYPIPPVVPIQR